MGTKAAREFSTERRQALADEGVAMPDGSYPIPDKDALRRAIQSYGRAKNPDAVKQHIIKRAKALGATSMLPEDWGGAPAGKASMAALHASDGACVLEDLLELISCEADEPDQLSVLQQAATLVSRWIEMERGEIGGPSDQDVDESMVDYGKAHLARGQKDVEVKAEGLTDKQLDSWLAGERSRRIVVVPFYGPLPGGKAGLDLDGEYFDADTDLYGPFPGLRSTHERMVDWHHDDDGVPADLARMKGAILGKIVLDAEPSTLHTDEGDFDGVLADFWANAGERRVQLIAALQRRKVPLFGSSQAVAKAVRKDPDGHIALWPLYRHTITTSPQNTYAVVPPLKAVLASDLSFDDVGVAALRAALVGIGDLRTDLRATSRGGERAAKARRLSAVITEAEALLPRLVARASSHGVPN
jgi:hypothetical protein